MSYFGDQGVLFALNVVRSYSSIFVDFDANFKQYHHGAFYLTFYIYILLVKIYGQYLKHHILPPKNAYCSAFILIIPSNLVCYE